MFTTPLRKSIPGARVRAVWIAAIVGLLASGTASAAQASTQSPPPSGDAVIASAGGLAIDTTSGSGSGSASAARSSSESGSDAITLNSSGSTTASPTTAPVASTPSASQVGGASLESPIVGSTSRRRVGPASRATVTQLQSGGPLVASSGTAAVTRRATHRVTPTTHGRAIGAETVARAHLPAAAATKSNPAVQVNVRGVQVFISPTAARRPSSAGAHQSAPSRVLAQIGSPGSGLAGFLPSNPRPAPAPGGPANTTLFGSASGSAGGSALLGIDALLVVAALIVGAAWRRRSWDLPVLPRQSALLSLALDRPG